MDINKHKEIKQLNRLAAIVRDSNDAVTVQDMDGNILAWNKGAEQMYGWSQDEALQMNIRQLVPEDKIKELEKFCQQLKSGKPINSFETKRLCKGGKVLNVWLTVTDLKADNGKSVEIATTERDISELKQLRKAKTSDKS